MLPVNYRPNGFAKKANRPNATFAGQTALKKAKFELFGL